MRRTRVWLPVLLGFAAGVAQAQAPPLGGELQVNTYTTGFQLLAAADAAPDGRFVVVWESQGQDGSGRGIFGQRFDETGAKDGAEFQVSTTTLGDQRNSSVAVSSNGSFVVVWTNVTGGVFGQRFDSAGARVGSEFSVSSDTTSGDGASVDAASDGRFVVAWVGAQGVHVQRFDAAGTKVGPEFLANTQTAGGPGGPAVAVHRSGSFVVSWTSYDPNPGRFAQRFDASGVKVGGELTLTSPESGPVVLGVDAAGTFVAAWTGQDSGHSQIFARRFGATGAAVEGPFQVDSDSGFDHSKPSIAVGPDGSFVVAFQTKDEDGSLEGIFARRFRFGGVPVGLDFQVNSHTDLDQFDPRVATGDGGKFVVIWWGDDDGSSDGVFRRRNNLVAEPLTIDTHATGATNSDLNGVLEPGETVFVEPSWKNVSGSALDRTGTASDLTGPGGAVYSIGNATADYGSIPSEATQGCYDGTAAHDCYRLRVGNPAARPTTHWDATFQEDLSPNGTQLWTLHVGDSFADVPRSQPFYKKIETLLHAGITTGCGATTYCPNDEVSRGQMAIFIAKGIAKLAEYVPATGRLNGVDYNCSSAGTSAFSDVAPTDSFCKHVHYIAGQNVTLGCTAGAYCPNATVTRDAMASFLAKAIVAPDGGAAVPSAYTDPGTGLSYSCNAGSPNVHFTDVPASNPFCRHIHYLWAKGVISGCGATTYCPTQAVNRDAMAKFLANAFQLQLYGP